MDSKVNDNVGNNLKMQNKIKKEANIVSYIQPSMFSSTGIIEGIQLEEFLMSEYNNK